MGNTGDEAVLTAIVQALRRRDPEGEITVLSAAPEHTREVHGVSAVSRVNPRAVVAALDRADLLISGGGSLLQDVTSLRSLVYYLGVVTLARARGVPVFFYAQGVGPLHRPLSRRLVARVATGVAGITVRDEASAALLRQIGVDQPPVRVTADPVFALEPPTGAAEPEGRLPGGRRPIFGFAFRPWAGAESWVPAVAEAAGELARRYGAELRWLPFQADRDVEVASALQAACPAPSRIVPAARAPQGMFAELARCDVVVAARLHALIMGAAAGRPVVGVSYDPKVDALLDTLGLAPAGALPGVSAEALARAAAETYERRAEIIAALKPKVAELRSLADFTADLALACARSRPKLVPAAPDGSLQAGGDRVRVLGVGVDVVTQAQAADRIAGWIEAARAAGGVAGSAADRAAGRAVTTRQVVTLNPEMIMRARRDPAFAALVERADLVTADGIGVIWAAGRLGTPLPERVTGVDLVGALLEAGGSAGWRFHFLGAAPGVAEAAAKAAAERHPGIVVTGWRHGYFPREEADTVAAEVAAAAPDVLLVALGSPAQEEFIDRYRERLGAGVALGVGGTFDVLAGKVSRAPGWMRRAGLEWLYRLVRNPRRFRRSLAIPAFVWQVCRQPRR